jgi:predicted nuclease with TOPRIM domain
VKRENRELNRINMENHKLLKRLQEKKSRYNVNKWEVERMEREKILK